MTASTRQESARPAAATSAYNLPDARGHFGQYGGIFVAETLMQPLIELRQAYERYRNDSQFQQEFADDLAHYVGRPSPLYFARRLTPVIMTTRVSGRLCLM